jgi:hypothetical protein
MNERFPRASRRETLPPDWGLNQLHDPDLSSATLGGAASPPRKVATPNRTGTHGRRGRVDQSSTTVVNDKMPIVTGNEIRSLT